MPCCDYQSCCYNNLDIHFSDVVLVKVIDAVTTLSSLTRVGSQTQQAWSVEDLLIAQVVLDKT